ncbi:MAG: hypothetical protein K0R50_416 [Eubacterium sp.]|jgi:hypothetical protein|nr:hypothetical protein [Eubacterium sp.]
MKNKKCLSENNCCYKIAGECFSTGYRDKTCGYAQKDNEENQYTTFDWIPCNERLPEPNPTIQSKPYLVTVKGAKMPCILYFAWDGNGIPTWHDACNYRYEVIAWQPLPLVFIDDGQDEKKKAYTPEQMEQFRKNIKDKQEKCFA